MRMLVGCVCVLVLTSLIMIKIQGESPFQQSQFDRTAWLRASESQRALMSMDATESRIVAGQNAEDVQRLLGEPDRKLTGQVDAGGNRLRGSVTYCYYLGSWPKWYLDDAFLYVHFDENEVVIIAEVTGY